MNRLAALSFLSFIQHDIEDSVVTDDFVVKLIYLLPDETNQKIGVTIDATAQPTMNVHYQGRGSLILPDRELRVKNQELIDAAKQRYTDNAVDGMPEWDNSNVRPTIMADDIVDTKDGTFKLVREKSVDIIEIYIVKTLSSFA